LLPHPSGWAEERRQKRIRARDCLSRENASETPLLSSTAACPEGDPDHRAAFSFAYFSFGDAKEK
jgi:hypothetical protein